MPSFHDITSSTLSLTSANLYKHMCMHTHVKTRAQPWVPFLEMGSTSSKTGSLMGLELTKRTHWLANEPRNPPVSTFTVTPFWYPGDQTQVLVAE